MSAYLSNLVDIFNDANLPWQHVVLASGWAVSLFEGYIGNRQSPYLSSIKAPNIPSALAPYLPASTSQKTYHDSQAYAKSKMNFGSVTSILDQIESLLLLTSFLAPVWNVLVGQRAGAPSWTLLKGFWDLAGNIMGGSEIKQSIAFVGLMTIMGAILGTPKAYYKNFVMEQKHGFNKMTRTTFWLDQLKGLLLSLVLEPLVLAGIIKIIHWVGKDGVLTIVAWLMAFVFSLQLVLIPLYPYVIAPLFNKFTPLPEDSPVFPQVKALATRLKFPLGKIWVMDGSKRSAHSNAYFFGLPGLPKQIVIYDTLLTQATPDEVEAILAHELGHWSHLHVPILLVVSLLQTSIILLTFTLFLHNISLLTAFGFPARQQPTIIALFLSAAVFQPLSAILGFATNSITRVLEYDADKFAKDLGDGYAANLKKALVRIHEENLAIYGVDWVYSAYNHNHPTLIERLEALDGKKQEPTREAKKDL
ncbi:hypothetical protein T439DRAFT_329920 [Meredithblackwellia eburnea MCA 4105]